MHLFYMLIRVAHIRYSGRKQPDLIIELPFHISYNILNMVDEVVINPAKLAICCAITSICQNLRHKML